MNTQETLINQLKPILKPYVQANTNLDSIKPTTNFIDDLGIDSASLVDMILDVEEVFDIEIDNLSMERMTTVGAAIKIIGEKQK